MEAEKQEGSQNNSVALMGALSGIIVGAVLHPLEIMKMGIIINPMKIKNLQDKNIVQQIYLASKHISQTEGLQGFFRGLPAELTRTAVSASIYFEMLRIAENYIEKNHVAGFQNHFMSSSLARVFSSFISNPILVVSARMEVPGYNAYKNMFSAFKKIYKYEGPYTFFKGGLATILKEGPFAGLYYMIYKNIKELLQTHDFHIALKSLFSGLTAGVIATATTHPFEIIRARLQVHGKFTDNKNHEYKGITDAILKIYKFEGFKGYTQGLAPRLIRKPISNAMTFAIFEMFHKHVYNENF